MDVTILSSMRHITNQMEEYQHTQKVLKTLPYSIQLLQGPRRDISRPSKPAMTESGPQKSPSSLSKEERRALLNELVEEHGDYLYRQAYRYFHDATLAEDLVQETFLAATIALAKFEGRSSYKTWLSGILRHKILDRLRKRTKEEVLLKESDSLENHMPEVTLFNDHGHWENAAGPLTWINNPESVAEQKDFIRVLNSCLKKFPESSRQLFMLREVEGLSREELCKEFDLSSTNIGVILYRMRLSLQQCMQINWVNGPKGA